MMALDAYMLYLDALRSLLVLIMIDQSFEHF